jgi:hypothetical protein
MLSKSATETLEMLHEVFGEYSLNWTAGLSGINVSRLVRCQLKMKNFQGNQASVKCQKMLKNFKNSSTKTDAEQMLTDTFEISYGVCLEILAENLNMCCIPTKSVSPTLANDDKQWCVNVLGLQDKATKRTYLLSLESLFPKLKMKLKGQHFESV